MGSSACRLGLAKEIAPAYYQTTWFHAACAVAFLAIFWGMYQLRVRQLSQQFEIGRDARVNEHTRIAREPGFF
jgi:hypothetical protein